MKKVTWICLFLILTLCVMAKTRKNTDYKPKVLGEQPPHGTRATEVEPETFESPKGPTEVNESDSDIVNEENQDENTKKTTQVDGDSAKEGLSVTTDDQGQVDRDAEAQRQRAEEDERQRKEEESRKRDEEQAIQKAALEKIEQDKATAEAAERQRQAEEKGIQEEHARKLRQQAEQEIERKRVAKEAALKAKQGKLRREQEEKSQKEAERRRKIEQEALKKKQAKEMAELEAAKTKEAQRAAKESKANYRDKVNTLKNKRNSEVKNSGSRGQSQDSRSKTAQSSESDSNSPKETEAKASESEKIDQTIPKPTSDITQPILNNSEDLDIPAQGDDYKSIQKDKVVGLEEVSLEPKPTHASATSLEETIDTFNQLVANTTHVLFLGSPFVLAFICVLLVVRTAMCFFGWVISVFDDPITSDRVKRFLSRIDEEVKQAKKVISDRNVQLQKLGLPGPKEGQDEQAAEEYQYDLKNLQMGLFALSEVLKSNGEAAKKNLEKLN